MHMPHMTIVIYDYVNHHTHKSNERKRQQKRNAVSFNFDAHSIALEPYFSKDSLSSLINDRCTYWYGTFKWRRIRFFGSMEPHLVHTFIASESWIYFVWIINELFKVEFDPGQSCTEVIINSYNIKIWIWVIFYDVWPLYRLACPPGDHRPKIVRNSRWCWLTR